MNRTAIPVSAAPALVAAVADAAAVAGLREPPHLATATGGGLQILHPDAFPNGRRPLLATEALTADGRPSAVFDEWLAWTVRHLARIQAWRRETGIDGPRLDDAIPQWARLAHPLHHLSRALRPDAFRATTSLARDLVVGSGAISWNPVFLAANVQTDAVEAVGSVSLPDGVVTAMAGRPLSSLFELPRTGSLHIDMAVDALVIEDAELRVTGSQSRLHARLKPAQWLPLESPPAGVRWHVDHPQIA